MHYVAAQLPGHGLKFLDPAGGVPVLPLVAIPIAAVAQIVAAVVNPEILVPLRKIVPAPRNPTPVTI